jgi:serine/threonine protein kinase
MTMTTTTTNLPDDLYEKLLKGQQTTPSDIDPCYELLKTLGYGYEGYVYLVRDQATGHRLVLKIYHDPFDHEPFIWDGLKLYAERIQTNPYGLYKVTLVERQSQIIALLYSFEKLYPLDYRLFEITDYIGESLFGQFCLMQWYLMSRGLGVIDPVTDNFLLALDGKFHYIDYGLGIRSVTEPLAFERGLFGYGFAMLLLNIHNINLRLEMPSSPNYSYDKPCIYTMCRALEHVAARRPWVGRILSEVCGQNASIFLDPQFYWQLGTSLRQCVPLPLPTILASQSLTFLKRIRDWVYLLKRRTAKANL